jgi:hypothetical protein
MQVDLLIDFTPSHLEIPVTSGEMTPEFLNASWEQIRDVLYVYPFLIE